MSKRSMRIVLGVANPPARGGRRNQRIIQCLQRERFSTAIGLWPH